MQVHCAECATGDRAHDSCARADDWCAKHAEGAKLEQEPHLGKSGRRKPENCMCKDCCKKCGQQNGRLLSIAQISQYWGSEAARRAPDRAADDANHNRVLAAQREAGTGPFAPLGVPEAVVPRLTVALLRAELKRRGRSNAGNKPELLARLAVAKEEDEAAESWKFVRRGQAKAEQSKAVDGIVATEVCLRLRLTTLTCYIISGLLVILNDNNNIIIIIMTMTLSSSQNINDKNNTIMTMSSS